MNKSQNDASHAYTLRQQQLNTMLVRSRAYRRRCHFAVTVAVKKGIQGVCRFNPVLDVGCGNPYLGMYRFLQRFNWKGNFLGVDTRIPREVVEWYRDDITVRTLNLDEDRLPFPPNKRHPRVEIATAFCVDTMNRVKNKDHLMREMQRVAAQVVVMGGVTDTELRRWGCQKTGFKDLGDGLPSLWGLWMCSQAETWRHRMDLLPPTAWGFFEPTETNQATEKRLFRCQHCGVLDTTGHPNFECQKCGKVNREEIQLWESPAANKAKAKTPPAQ